MQTRDQKLAAHIFGQVSKVAKSDHQKYGSMAHKLPVLIRTAGLVQALTFVEARGEKAHHLLLDHIADVVKFKTREDLLAKSRTAPLNEYMRLTQNVLAALLWYKRFAQSILGVEQGSEPDAAQQTQEVPDHAAESSQ